MASCLSKSVYHTPVAAFTSTSMNIGLPVRRWQELATTPVHFGLGRQALPKKLACDGTRLGTKLANGPS
jgi:hypothetical protein